jgi:hypothetical protein
VKLVELVQGIGLRRNTCEKAGEHAGGEHTARAAAHAVHSAYDAAARQRLAAIERPSSDPCNASRHCTQVPRYVEWVRTCIIG